MIEGITQTVLSDELDPDYKASLSAAWDDLRTTHHEMFGKVSRACFNLKAAGMVDLQYWDWATRYDIAAEYGKDRLNDSRVKLLGDLVDEGFLHAAERPNGHFDENGRWRPHNSSWVYSPNSHVLIVLAERAEKRIEAKIAAQRPEPKKPFVAEKRWKPARVPTLYEQYGMGNPDSDQEAEKPESVFKRLWHWLGEIDPFSR